MLFSGKTWCLVLLTVMGLVGVAHAETVHLLNNDRLTGRIVGMEEGFLVLDTDYADKIRISRKKVKSISSDRVLKIHFKSGEVVEGVVTSDAEGIMALQSETFQAPVTLAWDKVSAINPKPPKKPRWKGDVTLGANLKSGNTDKFGFSLGINATRKEAQHRFSLGFLYNYAEEEGELSTRNAYGKIKYDYFVTPKFYAYLSTELLYDTFKDLDLRTVVGPGVGYQVWDDEVKSLAFEGGIAYFNEALRTGPDKSWVTGRLSGNFRYKLANTVTFQEQLTFYPSLQRFGEFTLRNEAAVSSPLAFGWALRLSNIIEHDSDPEPGVRSTDCDLVLGLQYGF